MAEKFGYEWNETKRQATMAARGVDFADITAMDWESALTRRDPRHDEARFVTIGLIGSRLHVAAWCWRGQNLRVISLRKANAREVRLYDQS